MRFFVAILLLQLISNGVAKNECDPLYHVCKLNFCDLPTGLYLTAGGIQYDYSDFNAISLGSFHTAMGDVQGRLAVRNSFDAPSPNPNGFTVGDQLQASALTYSAVFGKTGNWQDGDVFPAGSKIFSGNSFAGPQYLISKTDSCGAAGVSCLDNDFNTLSNYMNGASGLLSNNAENVGKSINNGRLDIVCSSTETVYFVTLSVTDFNTVSDYSITSCPSNAYFVINIAGTENVTFMGHDIRTPAVIYNIISSTVVYVQTSVLGSILAPKATYSQTAGYVEGQVVALEMPQNLQINIPMCPGQHGGANGDPMIVGFNKKMKFWFNGWVGGIFNLYNDEYLNANSQFRKANELNGTVMETIAVEAGSHKISFNINDPHNNNSMSILVDGQNTTVSADDIIYLSNCIEIGMKKGRYLSIRTPMHDVKIKFGVPTGDGYITVDHLDFDINPPKKNHRKVGGVIGQTASNKSDREDSHFSVTELYGTEKSHFFRKTPFKC